MPGIAVNLPGPLGNVNTFRQDLRLRLAPYQDGLGCRTAWRIMDLRIEERRRLEWIKQPKMNRICYFNPSL